MKKLLIIDGHAFAFRAYYAFINANLKSPTDEPTGAIFGFFRMLYKLIFDFNPSHIAVTFDPGTPLERGKVFKDYKANRKPMPEDLRPQLQKIIAMVKEIEFPLLIEDGHEADDVIGAICKKYNKDFDEIMIFSGDKDLYQLLNENTFLYRPKKGVSEFLKIDQDWVKNEIGVEVGQIPDYMGLTGDTSDNIPGVRGVGEKSASKLIAEYGSMEGIYNNIEKIKNKSVKTKLEADRENAFMSRQLATLKLDIPVHFLPEDFSMPDYLTEEKMQIFKDLGLNAIYNDLVKKTGAEPEVAETNTASIETTKHCYTQIKSTEELVAALREVFSADMVSIDTETTSAEPMNAELLGISFSGQPGKSWYVPVSNSESLFNANCLDLQTVIKELKKYLKKAVSLTGQNIKYDMIVLAKYGVELKNTVRSGTG